MVVTNGSDNRNPWRLSVLALSSRFDGRKPAAPVIGCLILSVLALSSRFDGHLCPQPTPRDIATFSTRSVESF